MEYVFLFVALMLTFGGSIGFYLAIVSLRNMRLARVLAVSAAIGLAMMTYAVGSYLDAIGGVWWWTLSYLVLAGAILYLAFKKYPPVDPRKSIDDDPHRHDRPD